MELMPRYKIRELSMRYRNMSDRLMWLSDLFSCSLLGFNSQALSVFSSFVIIPTLVWLSFMKDLYVHVSGKRFYSLVISAVFGFGFHNFAK